MSILSRIAGVFRSPKPSPRASRLELAAAFAAGRRSIRARYDAAQTTDDNTRHWAAADTLDADSANSAAVRGKLVPRSRYETENNGQGKGIVLTHANYVVGRGPKLRMQTADKGFNTEVETAWRRWCKAVKLARKLRTQVKAKVRDGEGFLIVRANPGVPDPVKLDVTGIECEQVATPYLEFNDRYKIDGIEFDEFGNPTYYTLLKQHPGASNWFANSWETERVPAKFVLHLFREDRPGQHRAVPELTATMGLFAASRRWREATIRAAENIADFSVFLKSELPPDEEPRTAEMATLDIDKGMLTALPWGTEPFQAKAEQPASTYNEFNRSQICEEARPLNMPYNIAAADSSDYSFSGGRLDHLTYFVSVDVEQSEIEDLALDPLFAVWFALAVDAYRWDLDDSEPPSHSWVWPAKPQIDDEKTARARQTGLASGTTTLRAIYAEDGADFEDALVEMAEDYGVSVDEMRAKLFAVNFQRASSAPTDAGNGNNGDGRPPRSNGVNRLPSRNGNGRSYAGAQR